MEGTPYLFCCGRGNRYLAGACFARWNRARVIVLRKSTQGRVCLKTQSWANRPVSVEYFRGLWCSFAGGVCTGRAGEFMIRLWEEPREGRSHRSRRPPVTQTKRPTGTCERARRPVHESGQYLLSCVVIWSSFLVFSPFKFTCKALV